MNSDRKPEPKGSRHPLDHIADATERRTLARLLTDRRDAVLAHGRDELARRGGPDGEPRPTDLLPHALAAFVDLIANGRLEGVDAVFAHAVENADPSRSLFDAANAVRHALGAVARAALTPALAEAGASPDGYPRIALLMAAREAGGARLHAELTRTVLREMAAEREQQMRFYREVVRAATNDSLRLTEPREMPEPHGEERRLVDPLDASRLRHQALHLAESTGMPLPRAEDFALAVGEAASNVLKHAVNGRAHAWRTEESVFVFLSDAGQGITMDVLPKALSPGWSSIPSLGMGFTLMMEMADILWLSTSMTGTQVCIQQNIVPPEPPVLESLLMDGMPLAAMG